MNRNERSRTVALLAGARGLARKRFFAEGGDPKQWRKASKTHGDKRKERNRRACREQSSWDE